MAKEPRESKEPKEAGGIKDIILKHALKNAISYGGKASAGAVLGHVLAGNPNLRQNVPEVKKEIDKILAQVNSLSLAAQEAKLLSLAPEMLEEKRAEVRISLPELPNAEKGKVVMRFEPSPSGALHIGHAFVFLLNAEYCKKYDGKLYLRVSDTNPSNIHEPAYKLIEQEARWITDCPFNFKLQSDNVETYYKYAEELIKKGKAYVCTCSSEQFKKLVDAGKACPHRELPAAQQMKEWKKMLTKGKEGYKEGQAVLRIKTDLKAKNPALREWPAFRITESEHPKQGTKYRVWPLMNFAVAIDDALQGMTHVLRGKDHIVNTERQLFIFDYMKWKKPHYIHIGRINFSNLKLSASATREAIENKEYSGWDDIRLPFLAALKRRGLQPGAFANYAIAIGPSKVDKTLSIEEFMQIIYDNDRKILDPETDRYFFVQEPIPVSIEGAPKQDAKLPLHPEQDKGFRTLKTGKEFYLAQKDLDVINKVKDGQVFRLMHLFNFKNEEGRLKFHSQEHDPGLRAKLIHWLPADEKQLSRVVVKMPDGTELGGWAEKSVEKLKQESVIQFERFGFCCKQGKNEFWFGHR